MEKYKLLNKLLFILACEDKENIKIEQVDVFANGKISFEISVFPSSNELYQHIIDIGNYGLLEKVNFGKL